MIYFHKNLENPRLPIPRGQKLYTIRKKQVKRGDGSRVSPGFTNYV